MSVKSLLFDKAKDYLQHEARHLKKQGKQYLHKDESQTAAIVGAALAGLIIGIGIGILFAPQQGRETRTNIADGMRDLGNTLSDKARQGKEKLANVAAQTTDKVKSQTGTSGSASTSG